MKKITTVGGGTGTYVVLSGLKKKPVELSAIVSVADDGGSTGRLRDAYGYLPQGDLRQALVALSEDESILRQLFTHRFSKGELAGHNFGNMFLVALTEILGTDTHALEEAAKLLRVKGRVIPVSDSPAVLCADLNGVCVEGQTAIQNNPDRGAISRLYLKHTCRASDEACAAIQGAHMVVLGPGDLYTSTLANFVTEGLSGALRDSPATFVYVTNLFSTPESGRMTAQDYVRTVTDYVGRRPDKIVVNTRAPSPETVSEYAGRGQHLIIDDLGDDSRVVRADILSDMLVAQHERDTVIRSLVRHDPDRLADLLVTL